MVDIEEGLFILSPLHFHSLHALNSLPTCIYNLLLFDGGNGRLFTNEAYAFANSL